jgi:hypothetical protein
MRVLCINFRNPAYSSPFFWKQLHQFLNYSFIIPKLKNREYYPIPTDALAYKIVSIVDSISNKIKGMKKQKNSSNKPTLKELPETE